MLAQVILLSGGNRNSEKVKKNTAFLLIEIEKWNI